MEEPKTYKPRLRILKSADDAARAGQRGKDAGSVMRKRELQSRLEGQRDKLLDELEATKKAQAIVRSLLEAMVRRHGATPLAFDFLEECTGHEVEWPQSGHFGLTIQLKTRVPEEAAPPEPVSDDPFVANLGPRAKIAYEDAVAKAKAEEAEAMRRGPRLK